MSDHVEFSGAAEYMLSRASGQARGDTVREIIKIMRQVANGLAAGSVILWTTICPAGDGANND